MLPESDMEHLASRSPGHLISNEGGMICVVLPNFQLPSGFSLNVSDLLLRLSPGYPDVPPDMWWFSPPVRRTDGVAIAATQVEEQYLGRLWQRWSRHFQSGQWRSGIDSLESYLTLVNKELHAAAPSRAA
jgi:hypothetical protein